MSNSPSGSLGEKPQRMLRERGVSSGWWTVAVVVGVFLVVAGSFIVARVIPNRAVFDQRHYHQPTIEAFAKEWPVIDVWDYLSATTPGYHWVLAGVARIFGAGVSGLQLCSMLISAGMFAVLAWMVTKGLRESGNVVLTPEETPRGPGGEIGSSTTFAHPKPLPKGGVFDTLLLCLPLLCCNYLLIGGIALLPDNAGWLGVFAILALALHAKSMRLLCGAGCLVLLALVLTRQVHIWTCGLLVLAAWLGFARSGFESQSTEALLSPKRFSRGLVALAACMPALVVLALFVRYWGGLVPPRFQLQYPPKPVWQFALSPALAFILCVSALIGAFLAGFWWQGFRLLWARYRLLLACVVIAGLVITIVPPTNFDYLAGRRTGLWNLTRHACVLFGRTSVLIAALAPIGGVVLASFVVLLRERGLARDAWILLATLAGYAAVLTASNEVWQRYVEPLVLVVMVLLSARVGFDAAPPSARSVVGGQRDKERSIPSRGSDRLSPVGGTGVRYAGVIGLSLALLVVAFKTFSVGLEKLSDPPPPAITPEHSGPTPPVLLSRPEKPAGKAFW